MNAAVPEWDGCTSRQAGSTPEKGGAQSQEAMPRRADARRPARLLRLGLLLPALTGFLFAALSALSFLELGTRAPRAPEAKEVKEPEEVSAEVLARYRKEAERFEELRLAKRRAQSVAEVLSPLETLLEQPDGPAPYMAALAGDLRALASADSRAEKRALEKLLEITARALSRRNRPERLLALLEELLLRMAAQVEDVRALTAARGKARALLARVPEERPRLSAALALLLERVGGRQDRAALSAAAERARELQVRRTLEKAAETLCPEGGTEVTENEGGK